MVPSSATRPMTSSVERVKSERFHRWGGNGYSAGRLKVLSDPRSGIAGLADFPSIACFMATPIRHAASRSRSSEVSRERWTQCPPPRPYASPGTLATRASSSRKLQICEDVIAGWSKYSRKWKAPSGTRQTTANTFREDSANRFRRPSQAIIRNSSQRRQTATGLLVLRHSIRRRTSRGSTAEEIPRVPLPRV